MFVTNIGLHRLEIIVGQKEHNHTLESQNFNTPEELYNSITKEGSLGLLALGYQGLLMWRKKRAELEAKEVINNVVGGGEDEKK